jgi:hypothetical protein
VGALSPPNPVRQRPKLEFDVVGREVSIGGALCWGGSEYWLAALLASETLGRSNMDHIVGWRERAAHAPASQLFSMHRADL